MFIYKITNLVNDKIYIGQVYNKSVQARFSRHINDASPESRSYLDRAIYKYGADNFKVETIDTAMTLDELNEKERYWISYYNSTDAKIGYNLTLGGDGGNTYLCKSSDEMDDIKRKLAATKVGALNPNAKPVKCKNVKTNEEFHFDTVIAATHFLGIQNKSAVFNRCTGKITCLYKGTWNIAWEDEEYKEMGVFDASTRNGNVVVLANIETGESRKFTSINNLAEYLGMRKHSNINVIRKRVAGIYKIEVIS